MTADSAAGSRLLPVPGARIEVAGLSRRGPVRRQNQDRWAVSGGPDQRGCLLALADGMGGQPGGSEAADAAIRGVLAVAEVRADSASALGEMVVAANGEVEVVRRQLGGEPGTTLLVAVIGADRVDLAHLGDGRGYLVRGGRAQRLTEDHTWAAELVASGQLSEEQARHDPRRNLLRRAVVGDPVEPDLVGVRVGPGDVVVLCSDGLWEPLADAELGALLGTTRPLTERVLQACEQALAAGSTDNVTLVAAAILPAHDRDQTGPALPFPDEIVLTRG